MRKPEQIRILEKELGVSINNKEEKNYRYSEYTFSLDHLGNVVELILRDCGIQSVSHFIEIRSLKQLNLFGNNIQDLSSIATLTNLEVLNIGKNKIKNYAPLANLQKLRILSLERSHINDISQLCLLNFLREINLSDNEIEDISQISGLEKLESLNIEKNKIKDISPLLNLKNLTQINLSENLIKDISAISSLRDLRTLDLTNNRISNVNLRNFDRLKTIKISGNPIETISLENIKYIEKLNLKSPRLVELKLTNLTSLEFINLYENPVKSVNLRELPKIEYLNLSYLKIDNISIVNLNSLKSLDLSCNQIADLGQIDSIKKLTFLNLSNNKIADISRLSVFGNLKTLNLSNNKIADISRLSVFENLKTLNLSNNKIEDVSSLKNLKVLENLDLGNNSISAILDLDSLVNLTYLDLRNNQISDISVLKKMNRIVDLDIDLNPIINYSSLRYLNLLEALKVRDNIDDFTVFDSTPFLKAVYISGDSNVSEVVDYLSDKDRFPTLSTISTKLPIISLLEKQTGSKLTALYYGKVIDMVYDQTYTLNDKAELVVFRLRRKKIHDMSFLRQFPKIEILDLRLNKISDISILQGLTELREIHLYNNNISYIPLDFFDALPNLEYINVSRNPIENIPPEIFDKDENVLDSLKIYLNSLRGEKVFLHQAKMILVGNGEVGKTSIRIKLLDRSKALPRKEDRTQGLDIDTYRIKNLEPEITKLDKYIDFDLYIWDFGGQGRYREVQQLFCSRKALYLFVTSIDDNPNKEDYIGFEYWLSMAKAYGYDQKENWQSPIIHIVNKCDLGKKPINEEHLLCVFENIHDFVKISCQTLHNFDKLEESIRAALPKVSKDAFTNQFSKKWFDVKEELQKRKQLNHITLLDYQTICQDNGLNEAEGNMWLDYLDRIGVLIFFKENLTLNNFIVLNPLWIKDSMYKVLDSKFTKKGILEEDYLPYIWEGYNDIERKNLLEIMLAYKFSYPQKNSQGYIYYVIPSLFPDFKPEIPKYLSEYKYDLRFDYYPFLPAGSVSKLMVELHKNIYQDLRWKNSCVFHMMDDDHISYAEVIEDWEKKCIFVRIGGYNLHGIYNLIRKNLVQLLSDLKKTKRLDILEMEVKVKVDGEYESPKTIVRFGKEKDFWFLFAKNIDANSSKEMERKQIFFSYAWGGDGEDGDGRELIVNKLYDSLTKNNYVIVRDKVDLGYKGLISEFMDRIGKSDKIILVISDKYVRSPYCMFELYEIARNCKFDKLTFREKIIPVTIERIDFTNPQILEKYLSFWQEQQSDWEILFSKSMGHLAPEQFDRYDKVRLIYQHIAQLMDWLADMNTLTTDLLSQNDFEIIKSALNQ